MRVQAPGALIRIYACPLRTGGYLFGGGHFRGRSMGFGTRMLYPIAPICDADRLVRFRAARLRVPALGALIRIDACLLRTGGCFF